MISKFEVRQGTYYDSIILMQLQKSLSELDGVTDAAVVMATEANKTLLRATGFESIDAAAAHADDLVIVVKGEAAAVDAAMGQVDALLTKRKAASGGGGFRPKTLKSATRMLPEADWVLISVPGRYATQVADDALDLNKNVFLYSDNVSVEDEFKLKTKARDKGLMVMGPDCGTAIIDGIGLGFANRVYRGDIGIVAASGTGLQAITSTIHQRGFGISQAIGTGGRDLKDAVQATTMLQGIARLAADEGTKSLVILSKPPSPAVTERVIAAVRATGKPAVIYLMGQDEKSADRDNIQFADSFETVVAIAIANSAADVLEQTAMVKATGFVRGLFSGGTLAFESVNLASRTLSPLYTNTVVGAALPLPDLYQSQQHTIIDLGDDQFTQGRLHPMMDNELRLRRLVTEAADADVGIILFDIVLGDGAHPDPAGEFAPVIADMRMQRDDLIFVAVIIGTDQDPQGFDNQIEQLLDVGVIVVDSVAMAIEQIQQAYAEGLPVGISAETTQPATPTFAAINVGVETFHNSLIDQGAASIHVDWKPPAGGNEKMMSILAKLKASQGR